MGSCVEDVGRCADCQQSTGHTPVARSRVGGSVTDDLASDQVVDSRSTHEVLFDLGNAWHARATTLGGLPRGELAGAVAFIPKFTSIPEHSEIDGPPRRCSFSSAHDL